MKTFKYQARDNTSKKLINSTIQADTESNAGKIIISQGLVPLKIKELKKTDSIFSRFSNRISNKDKIVFIRQLSTVIAAGLPISQSFQTVFEQTSNKKLKYIIGEIMSSVEGGKSLASSFGLYPRLFNNVFISLITAGEASGTLDLSLSRIANQQEKDAKAVSKIRGAMIYPIIVLVVIVGVLGFMLATVVPQVERLYKDLGKPMPPISQFMLAITNFSTQYGLFVLLFLIALVIVLFQLSKSSKGKEVKDYIKLKIPFFKKLFQNLYMSRFTRTAQTLLSSGVTMLDMLRITSDSVNNVHIQKALIRTSDKVKGGKNLSASLKEEPVISRLVSQMIGIGEQSGKIDEMMAKVADMYENELEQDINNISVTIEPVLMILLAVFAGVIVAAVLLPVYTLVGNVQF